MLEFTTAGSPDQQYQDDCKERVLLSIQANDMEKQVSRMEGT